MNLDITIGDVIHDFQVQRMSKRFWKFLLFWVTKTAILPPESIRFYTDTYIHGRANQNHAKNLEADLANLEYLKNDLNNSTFFFARI